MAIAFTLTDDPGELRELLDLTSRSLSDHVDTALAAVTAVIARERPAAVIHSTHPAPQPGDLEDIAHVLATSVPAFRGRRPLAVLADPATLWLWLPTVHHPDPAVLEAALGRLPDVRVAIGATVPGADGFRHSHSTAQDTRRLAENPAAPCHITDYERTQAVVLATQQTRAARHLVHHGNAAATARALYLHRNTVLSRLTRAEGLLPQPLIGQTLNVALALEILHWFGHARPAAAHR